MDKSYSMMFNMIYYNIISKLLALADCCGIRGINTLG